MILNRYNRYLFLGKISKVRKIFLSPFTCRGGGQGDDSPEKVKIKKYSVSYVLYMDNKSKVPVYDRQLVRIWRNNL